MVSLSLVIVTYNSADDIVDCLEAVFRQERAPRFETIVVDNGSQDGTAALVRSRFPQVKVIEQANLGFGAGNNRGAREATGDVLVFLNPDMAPEPSFLAALQACVARGQVATAQIVLKTDPTRINTAGHRLHFTGYGFVVGFREPRWAPGPPLATQGLSGAAFAMLREDYWSAGGFDEDFFLYLEDTEFSWRLQRQGFRIVVAPSAVTVHDYEFSIPAAKIAHLETGRVLLLRKHLPWYLWVAYAPSLALADALAWMRAFWLGTAGVKAKWHGVRVGWRRGIRTYRDLPRTRPHRFTSQAIPFAALSGWRSVFVLGGFVNIIFRVNTLAWIFRRGRTKIRRGQ